MFSGTMSVLALLFSIASFAYVNYDRRVKLLLRTGRVIGVRLIQTFLPIFTRVKPRSKGETVSCWPCPLVSHVPARGRSRDAVSQ